LGVTDKTLKSRQDTTVPRNAVTLSDCPGAVMPFLASRH
jgi:hypothetical protein